MRNYVTGPRGSMLGREKVRYRNASASKSSGEAAPDATSDGRHGGPKLCCRCMAVSCDGPRGSLLGKERKG